MLDFQTMADDSERFLTAIIEREDDIYVALCPEFDIASQGGSIEDALANLREAVDLFLQSADNREVRERRRGHIFVTQFLPTPG
jgi:predicted RNase H-like HicB family nuclease